MNDLNNTVSSFFKNSTVEYRSINQLDHDLDQLVENPDLVNKNATQIDVAKFATDFDKNDYLKIYHPASPFKLTDKEQKNYISFNRIINLRLWVRNLTNSFSYQHWGNFIENQDVKHPYVYPKNTVSEIVENLGSWEIKLIDKFDFPTLSGFWNIKDKGGNYYKFPLTIKQYQLCEPFMNFKQYLVAIEADALGAQQYLALTGALKDNWKIDYQPIFACKVAFGDAKRQKEYNNNAWRFVYYNSLFNTFIGRICARNEILNEDKVILSNSDVVLRDDSPSASFPFEKVFKLPYLEQITNRSFVRDALKKATHSLGVLNFNLYQVLHSDQEARMFDSEASFLKSSNGNYIWMLVPPINSKTLDEMNKLLPSSIEEISANSKSIIETALASFPIEVKDNSMSFENIEKLENHACIYLLLGYDKNFKDDDHLVVKVGRTANFKQRTALYQNRHKNDSNQFKQGSVVTVINALNLDNLPFDLDTLTLEGAEALFRNMLKQMISPKYGNEWFDGNSKKIREQIYHCFVQLKDYILKHPSQFAKLIHRQRKTAIASYIAQSMKKRSAEELIGKFDSEA